MSENFEERMAAIFGTNDTDDEKFNRQKEYRKKSSRIRDR